MGNTTSLRVAIQQGRWRDVKHMLEDDDEARNRARYKQYHISEAGTSGQTATSLHLACLHNPPESIVRMLIDINPDMLLLTSDPSGEVPLHCAVRCKKSGPADRAVRVLLERCPQAVTSRSSRRYGERTPLHLACAIQAPPAMITMLRDADPAAARTIQDVNGQTAWDIAKRHKGILSLVWRWRVRAILRSQSSIQREEAGGTGGRAGTEQVGLDGLPLEVPTVNIAGGAPSAPPLSSSEQKQKTPLDERDEICVVCWDGNADHALVPCGHLCLCANCSSYATLQGTLRGKCPVCKLTARSAMRVYHAGVPNPDAAASNSAATASAAAASSSAPTVPALGDATGSNLPVATGTLIGTALVGATLSSVSLMLR